MDDKINALINHTNELAKTIDSAVDTTSKLEFSRLQATNNSEKLMWKTTLGIMILMVCLMVTCVCITYCTTKTMNNFVDRVYDYDYPSISQEQSVEITERGD